MPKTEKIKINVKERVDDNICDLSLSELRDVPVREIACFKRVTTLDLSSNRLISLGKNFTILTRLTKLDLSKNQIKYLPDDFGLLRNLRHLDLYDNKLEHLPLSFGNLVNLRYLDLKGNPLVPPLAKVVGFCTTNKDCHDAARKLVKFMITMQHEAEQAQKINNVNNNAIIIENPIGGSTENINSKPTIEVLAETQPKSSKKTKKIKA